MIITRAQARGDQGGQDERGLLAVPRAYPAKILSVSAPMVLAGALVIANSGPARTVTCTQCHGSGWHLRCWLGAGCQRQTTPPCSAGCRFGTCDLCGGTGTISELVLAEPGTPARLASESALPLGAQPGFSARGIVMKFFIENVISGFFQGAGILTVLTAFWYLFPAVRNAVCGG
jgi:hypothetical protein